MTRLLASLWLLCCLLFALSPDDPQFDWMDKAIEENLRPFAHGIERSTLDETEKQKNVVRLKVEENRVIMVSGKSGACFDVLNYLCMTYGLPDMELLYHHEDGLTSPIEGGAPLFCSAKKKGVEQGILFLDWHTFVEVKPKRFRHLWKEIFERVNRSVESLPFAEKKRQIIWRGSTTDGYYTPKNWRQQRRGKICQLSMQYPQWINARFTLVHPHYCSHVDRLKKLLPTGGRLTHEQQVPYRYQICLEGNATSYWGDRWRLLSNSVVFMHESDWEHWFYPALEPWVHFVPVKSDLSDLMEKLAMMEENDQLAEDLARNARAFALANFSCEAMAIYCYKVLIKYAQILNP